LKSRVLSGRIGDANNGVHLYIGDGRWPPSMLWANVADTRGLAERWQIDPDDLVRKLRSLDHPELIAIAEVIDRVWARPDRSVDDVLSECAVQV
jgi:hypothetical protein